MHVLAILAVVTCWLCVPHVAGNMCGCEHRYDTLMVFYDSLSGPSWTSFASPIVGWNAGLPCTATWTGETCDGTDVTAIELQMSNLQGTMPAEIAALTGLQTLKLSINYINGTLPRSMAALTNLVTLDLTINRIGGTLPPEWSTMPSLVSPLVSNNQLGGTLPAEWGDFSSRVALGAAILAAWLAVPSYVAWELLWRGRGHSYGGPFALRTVEPELAASSGGPLRRAARSLLEPTEVLAAPPARPSTVGGARGDFWRVRCGT